VSSGGWNPEFNENITTRPFCLVEQVDDAQNGKCKACNRTSHSLEFRMRLFGTKYNGSRTWESARWDKELSPSLFYHSQNAQEDTNEEDEDVDDSDNDDDDHFSDCNDSDSKVPKSNITYQSTELFAAKKWSWWTRNVPEALK
jgi:hypothetical protein